MGVVTKAFPSEKVRQILCETGKQSIRERDLPAHVVVYYVIALSLYMQVSCREVLRCLLEGLEWLSKAMADLGKADVEITPRTKDVYYQHRALADGDIYFLVNNSKEAVSGKFTFPPKADKAEVWDPKTGETWPFGGSLTLAPRSGVFVVMSDQ